MARIHWPRGGSHIMQKLSNEWINSMNERWRKWKILNHFVELSARGLRSCLHHISAQRAAKVEEIEKSLIAMNSTSAGDVTSTESWTFSISAATTQRSVYRESMLLLLWYSVNCTYAHKRHHTRCQFCCFFAYIRMGQRPPKGSVDIAVVVCVCHSTTPLFCTHSFFFSFCRSIGCAGPCYRWIGTVCSHAQSSSYFPNSRTWDSCVLVRGRDDSVQHIDRCWMEHLHMI